MNQKRRLNQSFRYVAPVGLAAALTLLAPLACSGKVLSFDPTSSTAESLAVDGGVTIADLTDEQANQVCAWIVAGYPVPPFHSPIASDTQSLPGFVTGYGVSLIADPPACDAASISWIAIGQSACVANLRSSPCQATVASLEACEEWFRGHATGGADFSYRAAMTACAAFEGAANCDETVFQAYARNDSECASLLPVVRGATCPTVQSRTNESCGTPADGGAD
jgi:hypothetical protein